MPSPLGPYRSPPRRSEGTLRTRAARWVPAVTLVAFGLVVGAWVAPGVTAAVLGALALYVAAPWFISRAPGG